MIEWDFDAAERADKSEKIRFVKMGDFGVLPCFKTRESAGADFCLPTASPVVIQPGDCCRLGLQIGITAPEGLRLFGMLPFLSMVPRSSLRKRGVSFLGEGIIDCDYRGEIQALLYNHSQQMIRLEPGEAIGQFILRMSPVELLDCPRLDAVRGAGGFGSTGSGN